MDISSHLLISVDVYWTSGYLWIYMDVYENILISFDLCRTSGYIMLFVDICCINGYFCLSLDI